MRCHNATTDDIKKAFPGINDDEAIYSQSAYRMDEIKHNHIMIADNKLLDEVYELWGKSYEKYISLNTQMEMLQLEKGLEIDWK